MMIRLSREEQQHIQIRQVARGVCSADYLAAREHAWQQRQQRAATEGARIWNGEIYTIERILQYDEQRIMLEMATCGVAPYSTPQEGLRQRDAAFDDPQGRNTACGDRARLIDAFCDSLQPNSGRLAARRCTTGTVPDRYHRTDSKTRDGRTGTL